MIRRTTLRAACPFGLWLLLVACSSTSPDPHTGTGGSSGAGATSATGGSDSSGGRTQNTGGAQPIAGAASGGKASGGAGGQPVGGREDLNTDEKQELQRLQGMLDANHGLTAEELLEKRALKRPEKLSYRPGDAEFLDRIQESALKLNASELAKLDENGFVVSTRSAFPTFVRGYAAIYSEHLPVYVSADAILEAVHSSYEDLLILFESGALIPKLDTLLSAIHERVAAGASANPKIAADLDLYMTVARSLLAGKTLAPLAGGDTKLISQIVKMATDAQGEANLVLFGAPRIVDASQFKPRGHYDEDPTLSRYFRAMMWLGRMDFRLIETNPDGSQTFLRPQYEAMLLLYQSMSEQSLADYELIDSALRTFVGDSDNMTVGQVNALVDGLGGAEKAAQRSDVEIEAAIVQGGFGAQKIASQIMVNDGVVPTLPLARSFALFGQRYVIDSHVFSQVVYDRLPAFRMMPNPLDAAYAALGNNQALSLLAPELSQFTGYPGALESARDLVDAHDAQFWGGNLYNLWLSSLRALSPAADLSEPSKLGLPQVAATEAWGRRMLSAQLGSWAELRHDTLLYAKQSYTGVPSCDYPDAYIDPYPEFFAKLRAFAEAGSALTESFAATLGTRLKVAQNYFKNLQQTMTLLGEMAKNQREGTPFTAEQLAFINGAVRILEEDAVCTTIDVPDGWLADLYLDPQRSIEAAPTIADVHTQPADEAGNTVGKVLHVGAGWPRMMVTTIDTCQGPRAYVGVTFAYHELETTNFERLTDEQWKTRLSTPQANPSWVEPILAQ
ncbi:MAG TPA: DUF3160 domain-containing protein [Polyangiaceae bacterium]|nr:DUF3160 domain-containing protein [Polyangiaceae bacterium]